jgi:tRNA C32,U32 (ribose-2'-O)-methylase TrmJ
MIRRISARSALTETEYYKLMGIIRIIMKHIDAGEMNADSPGKQ